jgi:transposase
LAAVIRLDAVWLATESMDMRAGVDTALARVVKVFGGRGPSAPSLPFCQPQKWPDL